MTGEFLGADFISKVRRAIRITDLAPLVFDCQLKRHRRVQCHQGHLYVWRMPL